MKTIFRTPHSKNFTVIDNSPLHNPKLSFKARGLLAHMLTRPDNWSFKMKVLQQQTTDGRDSLVTGMRELLNAGYVTRKRGRSNGHIGEMVYEVHEKPKKQRPITGKSTLENGGLSGTGKPGRLISTYKGLRTDNSPSGRRAEAPAPHFNSSFDDTYGVLVKEGIERSGSISRKTLTPSWIKQVRLLRESGTPKKRIKQVVLWFVVHSQDKYTPKIYKIDLFRKKFGQLEDAMNRDVSDNPGQYTKVTTGASRIATDLIEEFEVPIKARLSLPQIVQISLNKYYVVWDRHRTLTNTISEMSVDSDVRDTVEYLDENFFHRPDEFVEFYFRTILVNKWFWHNDIFRVAFSFDGANFNRMAQDFLFDYSHDHKAWDQYKQLLGKDSNEGK